MTYAEAIQFLHGLQMFGANFGLETPRKLAALAGNPHEKLRFIHVAGTNGKGSTCAMLESIYRAAGLRVGLFTSPHLVSLRERIQINRQLISETDVARLAAELRQSLKEFPAEQHPTMFEVVTVMALKLFAEKKCDLVILETGLGGRLDATNIVTPLASVITNISLDHQQWLGDTLEKIGAEKAGIIKLGVPVVTGATQPEVLTVIERIAKEKNAPLTTVATNGNSSQNKFPALCLDAVALPLLGEHQMRNAALALAIVEILQKQIPVSEKNVRSGLATVHWPGRLQTIHCGGLKFLLDGAHNVAGVEALRAALLGEVTEVGVATFIVGFLGDKDWQPMCKILAPLSVKFFLVPVASERTASTDELANYFALENPSAEVVICKNLSEALDACKDELVVVVAGSLYLIGEALELLGHSPANTSERGLNEWSAKK